MKILQAKALQKIISYKIYTESQFKQDLENLDRKANQRNRKII